MFRNRNIFLPLGIIILICIIGVLSVSADTKSGYFYVKANLPENQIDKHLSYFDLHVKPGKTQTLSVTIFNRSDKQVQVSVGAVTASTNANGIIDYSKEVAIDDTLKYSFSDMVTVRNPIITIQPNSNENALFDIKIPKKKFKGEILGGFSFTQILDEDAKNTDQSVNINNVIAYAIAVKLTENNKKIKSELLLTDVEYKSVDYKPTFVNTIRNIKPKVMEAMAMEMIITNLDNDSVVVNHNNEKVAMAPNSIMPYSAFVDSGTEVIPGNYLSKIKLTYNNEEIYLEKEFKVSQEHVASAKNPEVPFRIPLWLGFIVLIIVALIIISVIFYIRMRKYKKRAVENEK